MTKKKQTLGRYVDINTDFGWKLYFGREENKELLIQFLNEILAGEKIIQDLQYIPPELDGKYPKDRRVIFDLHCKSQDGELFIIEMQQIYQDYFKDRALYYVSRLINNQVEKGESGDDYELPEIYFIGVLEFPLKDTYKDDYFIDVGLMNKQNQESFYDKLSFKFIVLPHFRKKENELTNYFDQWLYILKNLSAMNEMSKFLDKRIFGRIFDIGEVAKLKKEDQMSYEASLKHKRDWQSVLSTTKRKGVDSGIEIGLKKGIEKGIEIGTEKGIEMGKAEIIKNLIAGLDLSNEEISKMTNVSLEFVQQVRENLQNK